MAEIPKDRKVGKRKARGEVPVEQLSLEECFAELQEIVERLEKGELSLDESLQLFERGMQLSRRCERELQKVERRIQLILENQSGETQLEDFPFESEDSGEDESL